jgi:hypothetical protein
MGMFDEIEYRYKLPLESSKEIDSLGIDLEKIRFQTKDLDNLLDIYVISEEGRFLHRKVNYKWIDDDNAFLKGYLDEVSSEMVDTNYHGDILFYCYETVEKDSKRMALSIDYVARFTNGNLDNVRLKHFGIKDNTEYNKNIEKMLRESSISKNKWYNKYLFNTKRYHTFIRRPILGIFKNISTIFNSIYYWVSRHI